MALQILKLPIIMSRCYCACSSSNSFFFSCKLPYRTPNLSARWVEFKARNHPSVRTFASLTTEKGQPKKKKRRLDELYLERFQQYSRTFIQSWILQGGSGRS